MSTNDVPGASKKNADELAMGCWAEHDDGSLILVESTENNNIIFVMFNLSDPNEPLEYRHAMPESGFKKMFSFPPVGVSKEKWTWHDKTPFPWDRVMTDFKVPRPRATSAHQQMSAAQRVAESLNMRGEKLKAENYGHLSETASRRGGAVIDKIARAMGAAFEELTK